MTDSPTGRPGDRAADSAEAPSDQQVFARRALRWNAAYYAAAGVSVAAFASSIEQHLEVSGWVVATTGIAAVVWAGALGALARDHRWRRSATVASAVNGVAAVAIAYWAVTRGGVAGGLLGLFAAQIAAFGVAHAWVLLEH